MGDESLYIICNGKGEDAYKIENKTDQNLVALIFNYSSLSIAAYRVNQFFLISG